MHKTRELKTSSRFQLSDAVIVTLLLSFLLFLCFSFPSILTADNDHIALAIINTFNTTNNNTSLIPAITNHPPVANAGINQTVNENTTVMLNGIASDPEDPTNTLSYSWLQIAGPEVTLSNYNTTNPSFISPKVSEDTTLKFSLTAKDNKGTASIPAIVTITVKDVNQPPLADAGPDQIVNPGNVISLDAIKSKDPDNDPLTYLWVQTQGPSVKLNDADMSIATFTAPFTNNNITTDTDIIFKLKVTDRKQVMRTDDVKVTVKYIPPPNKPPIANAGPDQTVNAGDIVTLQGTGSKDTDGNITSYSWKQTAGQAVKLNGVDTITPSFTLQVYRQILHSNSL